MTSETGTLSDHAARAEALDAVVRRAQAGDQSAYEELLDRFEAKALLIARGLGASRQDAEDIAQEAFIKVFRYIRSYRGERSFRAYFYRIVMNVSRGHLARGARAATVGLENAPERAGPPAADSLEAIETLRALLQRLPLREREVIILRELQGLTTWQVARVLRISPITVRRHAGRALRHLKEMTASTENG